MTKVNKQDIFFWTVLAITTAGALYVLQDFLNTIILAFMFSALIYPLFKKFRTSFKLGPRRATLSTLLVSITIIILPLVIISNLFFLEALQFREDLNFEFAETSIDFVDTTIGSVNQFLGSIPYISFRLTGDNIDSAITDASTRLSSYIINRVVAIGASSAQFVTSLFIFFVLVYFLIPNMHKIRRYVETLSPLDDKTDTLYINRAVEMTVSMVKGTFLIALAQGLIGAFFLWIGGVGYIMSLTLLMIILSIIPVVGTAMVTVPIGLYLILTGDVVSGSVILFGQVAFISTIDNILRAELGSRDTALHPGIMLVSIIGGLQVFGILGFLYGPIVMILFITSLEVYTKHYL